MGKVIRTAMIAVPLLSVWVCLPGSTVVFAQADVEEAAADTQTGTIRGTIEARSARYRENTVVYIDHAAGDFPPLQKHPVVDQKSLVFRPDVTVITKGTTIDFLNSDVVKHNIFSPSPVADDMNLGTYSSDEVRHWTFNTIGEAVLLCNIHSEMEAWVVVRQNPYFAVTDKSGDFEIKDVPAGSYTLKIWNKKYSALSQEVAVETGETVQVSLELNRKKER